MTMRPEHSSGYDPAYEQLLNIQLVVDDLERQAAPKADPALVWLTATDTFRHAYGCYGSEFDVLQQRTAADAQTIIDFHQQLLGIDDPGL